MYKCKICRKEFDTQQRMTSHCSSHYSKSKRIERIIVTKHCEKCGKPFNVIRTLILKTGEIKIPENEKRFDTRSCANGQIHTKEWKSNISKGTKGKTSWYKDGRSSLIIFCKECGRKLKYNNKSGYCNRHFRDHVFSTDEYRKNLSSSVRRNVENGTHKGWQTRNIVSYPEKFFIDVLKNNQLFEKCEMNKPISKSSLGLSGNENYFLDFFFAEKMIDLEIDGKQHFYEDRIESDETRDAALTKNGYRVYRIKWKSINRPEGKAYIKTEIDNFLEFYNGQYFNW